MSRPVPSSEVMNLESKFKGSEIHLVSPESHYNETDTRSEYIDPLLDALGWDSRNRLGVYFANREVIREESQERDDSAAKKPDYTLRVNGISKFYVEAKRPAVNILTNMKAISQARRYGYTAGHPIVVLMNYRDLCIYDATIPIQADDRPETCRIYRWHYDEIAIEWARVHKAIGRSSVGDADWEEQFSSRHGPVQPVPADAAFVEQLNRWRVEIGQDIVERDPLITEPVLNDVVQRLLNRLIFVRMCEDRGIEGKEVLRNAFASTTAEIKALFTRLDSRYNTGLFANSDSSNDPSLLVDAVFLQLSQAAAERSPYVVASYLNQLGHHQIVGIACSGVRHRGQVLKNFERRLIVAFPRSGYVRAVILASFGRCCHAHIYAPSDPTLRMVQSRASTKRNAEGIECSSRIVVRLGWVFLPRILY